MKYCLKSHNDSMNPSSSGIMRL